MEALRLLSTASTAYFDVPQPDMLPSPAEESPIASPVEHLIKEEADPCRECGRQRSRRGSVASSPSSSKAGRTYYPCTNMKCRKGSARLMQRDFVTWEAHGDNPKCDCGLPSVQGLMGAGDPQPGYGYWKCAYGSCKYFSRDRKGRSVSNGEVEKRAVQPFIPWLLYTR